MFDILENADCARQIFEHYGDFSYWSLENLCVDEDLSEYVKCPRENIFVLD